MDPQTPLNCTCFNLRKATRAATQLYDAALKPSGLRTTQFSLLVAVDSHGPTGISELARALGMDRTTLSRNLKPLTERNLLDVTDGADRRQKPISLTKHGKETLTKAMPAWLAAQHQMVSNLGHDRWAGLLADLNAVSGHQKPS